MAGPPGIEYAGALYHVTSRGDRREGILTHGASMMVRIVKSGWMCCFLRCVAGLTGDVMPLQRHTSLLILGHLSQTEAMGFT